MSPSIVLGSQRNLFFADTLSTSHDSAQMPSPRVMYYLSDAPTHIPKPLPWITTQSREINPENIKASGCRHLEHNIVLITVASICLYCYLIVAII